MNVTGIIFSNLHDAELPMLTGKRTMGAVPFGGRYRLIDFPLSAMVNAGITDIRVIAHHNYQSLMEHIGAGKDWDLARRVGGIRIVPPYSAAYASPSECYDTRMQSLISIKGLIDRIDAPDVLLADCDAVGTPDLCALIEAHRKSGAGITVGAANALEGKVAPTLHIWCAKTEFLRELLREAQEKHFTSFTGDIVNRQSAKGRVNTFCFQNRFFPVNSFVEYYALHMLLVNDDGVRCELLENPKAPLFTATKNAPPVKYGCNAYIKSSLIADGCVIDGEVRGSVLFGGVQVSEGCVVENAIVMEGCVLTGGSAISCGVLDKNACLLRGARSLPIFVEEGRKIG